ncbi:MAG: small ribosomal subunit Rsm22 family protein [Treponema sp.]|nr:small ribosomal subunit Rsm22 family protein [Treponema sp.]
MIEKTFPMPGRFRGALPSQVAELSRLLTGGRGDRSLSYLSRPNFLSAYLRYFLPWNLYRLCLLLPSLDLKLSAGDIITDLGSGPLTFVSALWMSRPDLRKLPLEFRCIDRCAPALEAGKKFFAALAGGSPWKLYTVRESVNFRTKNNAGKKQSALVCAVNLLNELYDDLPHSDTEGLRRISANIARNMCNYASPSASILTVEPGVPHSGHFIAMLRAAFLELDHPPLSPCTHTAACPLSGGKKRWCHFSYESVDAPKDLRRLSAAAGIPKERLTLSYLLTGHAAARKNKSARVVSDAFPLPDNCYGRYGCSEQGLVLLTGDEKRMDKTVSGALVTPIFANGQRDAKSGALLAEVQ